MNLGQHLRELRCARGLSVVRLAAAAKLGRNTVTRWEGGHVLPRLPELHALLDALDASAVECRKALELLDVPRAVRIVRAAEYEGAASLLQPRGGDLLRAMRVRRGWSQEQVADWLRVARTTLARWEQSETWPSAVQLHSLCAILGAQLEEIVALTVGRFPLGSQGEEEAETSPEAIRGRLATLKDGGASPQDGVLNDLHFLTLQARAFPLAQQGADGRELLAEICVGYLPFLFSQYRVAEMARYSDYVLELIPGGPIDTRVTAAIFRAEAAMRPVSPFALQKAAESLQPWFSAPVSPGRKAWLHHTLAWICSGLRRPGEALEWARRAYQMPGLENDPERQQVALRNLAGICTQAGRPGETLELLTTQVERRPDRQVHAAYHIARAYRDLGNNAEAQSWLVRARAIIEAHSVNVYRGDVESLEAGL